MSNPALNRLIRSGGVNNFHVSRGGAEAVSRRGDPYPIFGGETHHGRFSAKTEEKSEAKSHDFAKKENREGGGEGKKRKKDDESDDDDDDGPHFKKSGIHARGSDAGAQSPASIIPVTIVFQTLTCIVVAQTETARRAKARTRRSQASWTRTRMAKLTRLRRSRAILCARAVL